MMKLFLRIENVFGGHIKFRIAYKNVIFKASSKFVKSILRLPHDYFRFRAKVYESFI